MLQFSNGVIPVVTLRYQKPSSEGVDILRNFSDICEKAECERPHDIQQYIDNMERLGLFKKKPGISLADENLYISLENHPMIGDAKEASLVNFDNTYSPTIIREYYEMTHLGRSFVKVCIAPKF